MPVFTIIREFLSHYDGPPNALGSQKFELRTKSYDLSDRQKTNRAKLIVRLVKHAIARYMSVSQSGPNA